MIKLVRQLLPCLVLGVAMLVPAARAQSDTQAMPDQTRANVRIEVRIGRIEGEKRTPSKSYHLVVAAGSSGSRLLSGSRVPFPVSMSEEDGAEEDGMREFVYQNVGFTTHVRAWILDETKIRIVADIEDSEVVEAEDGGPPRVETRELAIDAILTDGEALELTRVEGVVDADTAGFVELEASILR